MPPATRQEGAAKRKRAVQKYKNRLADKSRKSGSASGISGVEWGLILGAAILIDFIQAVLNFLAGQMVATVLLAPLGSGLLLFNEYLSTGVGFAFPSYYYFRGVNMNAQRVFVAIVSIFLKEIPFISALPIWTGQVALMYFSIKAQQKILEETGVDIGKFDASKLKTGADIGAAFKAQMEENETGEAPQLRTGEGEEGPEKEKPTGIAAEKTPAEGEQAPKPSPISEKDGAPAQTPPYGADTPSGAADKNAPAN